ncbi:MAG: phenylacetate--CoA ligase family protein [Actinomycetota bacterium]
MIFEAELESMEPTALARLQSERLAALTARVYENVDFYRVKFDGAGVKPADITTIDDITRLPITRKQDLRDHYPFGLFALERRDLSRIHASSGTTGKPTVVGYTREDVDLFARVNARCLAMAGAEPGLMLHNAYGYGLFTGGLGLHYGAERLGMIVVPVSGGMTERQLTLIADFRPDMISCTPSYGLTLVQEFVERGVSPDDISMSLGILGAEPWTERMRAEVDAGLGLKSSNIYGLSEIIGPGVSCECIEERNGSHINEDHFFPEILDPTTGEPLPEGEEGVLVFTTLTKEALPLLRYWTGDITSLSREQCGCGRTLRRMALIKGRTDDMLIIRGVNLYPTEVELVLGNIAELSPHYRLVVTRESTLDELTVETEVTDDVFRTIGSDVLSAEVVAADEFLDGLRARIQQAVKDSLGVTTQITLKAPGTVPRSEGGKLNRVDDRRELV